MLHPRDISEQFFLDVAVGVSSFEDICLMHNLDPQEVNALENDVEFQRRVTLATQIVDEDGSAFAARCRTVATKNVHHVERMIADPDVPASTRLDAFRLAARLGKLEPEKATASNNGGAQLSLTIIAPDGSHQQVLGAAKPIAQLTDASDAEDADWAPVSQVEGFF